MFDGTGYFPVLASIIIIARYIVLTSERALAILALSLIPCVATKTIPDSVPIIAITTNNSINVNPPQSLLFFLMIAIIPQN